MSETKILNEVVQRKAPIGINSPIVAAVVVPSINRGAISGLTLHLESKFYCTINCMMTIKASSLSTSRIQMSGRVMIMEFIYRHLSKSPGKHNDPSRMAVREGGARLWKGGGRSGDEREAAGFCTSRSLRRDIWAKPCRRVSG